MVKRALVLRACAAVMLALLLAVLLTAPQRPSQSGLAGEATKIARQIANQTTGATLAPSSIGVRRLKAIASQAVARLSLHDELVVVIRGDHVLLRSGTVTADHGATATAAIIRPRTLGGTAARPLGYVYLTRAVSDVRQMTIGRLILVVLLALGLLGVGVALGIEGATTAPRPIAQLASEPPKHAIPVTETPDPPDEVYVRREPLASREQDHGGLRERQALVAECIEIVDGARDERVARRISAALEQIGVETVAPQPGERFDASRHRIAATTPSTDSRQRRTIHAVVRPGYLDHGELLRRADVNTYTAPDTRS